MPFETPTLPALIARAQSDLAGSSSLLRSDAEVLARVHGAASFARYGHQKYIADQILPDTADEDTLRRMARARLKRDRLAAVAATGHVTFTGAVSALLDAGTLLQRDDGVRFRVAATAQLAAAEGTARVEAVDTGPLGNTEAGTALRLVSPVLGVNSVFTVAAPGLQGGTEQESIETLRGRVIRSYRVIAHGGSKSDYVTWATEVAGVTRAWLVRHWVGPGTVGLFFVRDNDIDIIPGVDALASVKAYIEQERPVTAEVYVLPPQEKPVQYQLSVTPDSSAVRRAVEASLVDLHNRESELGGVLLGTHISEAISGATGERDHKIHAPIGDVAAQKNELLTYGGVLWL
ncbi:baseplate J/gp47 family protein [Pseudomonas sp. 148P]|uniref:Baseplate J/gp47 family protein n=1 Tax=Pseudomonas ulcerans TaxID=3115852 RepID=A0ABU7HW61_9PSED|nr:MULTISPECIES: baseplate J/gp47 family protein [unclassified Pseudomonas]MEE1922910.1 baseplate J/gp47 family protein [Pseudomonas sp. 147P]MEE1935760.1 baseplate J/gp47 family protein [Pseudomonas sp. 148P]